MQWVDELEDGCDDSNGPKFINQSPSLKSLMTPLPTATSTRKRKKTRERDGRGDNTAPSENFHQDWCGRQRNGHQHCP